MTRSLGIFFLLVSFAASAKDLKLVTEQGQILVPELAGWELGRDMFGMPFILFSPRANGQRSNMSLTATGVDVDVDLAAMAKNPEAFKAQKQQWGETVGATITGFIPYALRRNTHDHAIHSIGVEYTHQEKDYVETSYYVDCRKRLIYAKTLRLKQNAEHETSFQHLLTELDCGL